MTDSCGLAPSAVHFAVATISNLTSEGLNGSGKSKSICFYAVVSFFLVLKAILRLFGAGYPSLKAKLSSLVGRCGSLHEACI